MVYFATEYIGETNSTTAVLRIVDDRSLPGDTLGKRRLRLRESEGVKVYPVSVGIYFLADLIKLAKATTWFIDSSGRVFQYKKYARAKLETKKIKQVLPAAGLGCVIEVAGLSQRFKSMTRPKTEEYAVLLNLGKVYILYGLSDNPKPPSWRLI